VDRPATAFGRPDLAPADQPAITLDWQTRVLCVALIVAIVALGVLPRPALDALTNSIAGVNLPLPGR